jgi:hypothetical protein
MGKNIPNDHEIYHKAENIPNVCKIGQIAIKYNNYLPLQALQNLSKIGIFGLKIYHLATLITRMLG